MRQMTGIAYLQFTFSGLSEAELFTLVEECDYAVTHRLIQATELVEVDVRTSSVYVQALLEMDIDEEDMQKMAADLHYAFPRVDGKGEYDVELVDHGMEHP